MYTSRKIEGGKARETIENGGLVERLTKDGTYDQYVLKDEAIVKRSYNVEDQNWTDFIENGSLNWAGRYDGWYVIRDEDGKDIRVGKFIEKIMYRKPFLMDIFPSQVPTTTAPPMIEEDEDKNPNYTLVKELSKEFDIDTRKVISELTEISKEGVVKSLNEAVNVFRTRKTPEPVVIAPAEPAPVFEVGPKTYKGADLCRALLDGKTMRIGTGIYRIHENTLEECLEGKPWVKSAFTLNGILDSEAEEELYLLTFKQAVEEMKNGATCIPQCENVRYWMKGTTLCSTSSGDGFPLEIMDAKWRIVEDDEKEE